MLNILNWFKKNEPIIEETRFLTLSIGQKFQRIGKEKIYIKTDDFKYQTIHNGLRCDHWFVVTEDFVVKPV